MSLRARPISKPPAQPGARLNHVMAVGHAATVKAAETISLEEFLADLDEISGKWRKPTKADVTKFRKEAADSFKKGAAGGQRMSKEQARELANFMIRKYNGAKNLEHWMNETPQEMAKQMSLRWRQALSPANWNNIKTTVDGDRKMMLETGANMYGVLHFDKITGMQVTRPGGATEKQNTIQMTLTIVSAIPEKPPPYSTGPQQMGSEVIWKSMNYSELAKKVDEYILKSVVYFYQTNDAVVQAARWAKLGKGVIKDKAKA